MSLLQQLPCSLSCKHESAYNPAACRLAVTTPNCCLLQGYAGLHQAQRSPSDEQGRHAVQAAVGHLFQAMAVFHTAAQPTQYGQQKDLTDSCNMVKQVVHDILVGLTGSCDKPGPQVCHCTPQIHGCNERCWPALAFEFLDSPSADNGLPCYLLPTHTVRVGASHMLLKFKADQCRGFEVSHVKQHTISDLHGDQFSMLHATSVACRHPVLKAHSGGPNVKFARP